MKSRTISFVSVVVFIVYGTLTFVAVPLHFHHDSLFSSGPGSQAIVQHDDALHCHHRDIETHDHCTICSFVLHSIANKVVSIIPQFVPKSPAGIAPFSFAVLLEIYSSHSRRGPPLLLG